MATAVISAVYGDQHLPPPPPLEQRSPVDQWLLVSDRERDAPGWSVVVDPVPLPPRHAAKRPKCRPDLYTDADLTVWLDAQVQIRSPFFVQRFTDELTGDKPIALFAHPRRAGILAEAKAGQGREGRGRYAGQPSVKQARHYLAAGHPDGWGLWCGGFIARRMTSEVAAFGAAWWHEIGAWSRHDQIALPYTLRQTLGRRPATLPWPGLSNDMFRLIDPRKVTAR